MSFPICIQCVISGFGSGSAQQGHAAMKRVSCMGGLIVFCGELIGTVLLSAHVHRWVYRNLYECISPSLPPSFPPVPIIPPSPSLYVSLSLPIPPLPYAIVYSLLMEAWTWVLFGVTGDSQSFTEPYVYPPLWGSYGLSQHAFPLPPQPALHTQEAERQVTWLPKPNSKFDMFSREREKASRTIYVVS